MSSIATTVLRGSETVAHCAESFSNRPKPPAADASTDDGYRRQSASLFRNSLNFARPHP